jgi:predicted SprT family Zn-dependent metalloprotease
LVKTVAVKMVFCSDTHLGNVVLQFRPVRDLKETLLHEMIHAALFLGNVRDDGDHGPKFKALMNKINKATCADSQVG